MARRFVLLDRDGTLNAERHYLADPDCLELLPGVVTGLRHLQDAGLGLVVVTNQSGIGRGYFDRAAVDRVHDRLRDLLAGGGVALDGVYVCPHAPDAGCACRKPASGLALAAAAEHGFDPATSFVIGDKAADIRLGHNLGATAVLVRTGYGEATLRDAWVSADYTAADLLDAACWIASRLGEVSR